MSPGHAALLTLRVTLETGIVGGLAWWGYDTGGGGGLGILLAILAPAIGFGLWGAVDFRQAGRYAEPLRLAEELVISGLAAWGLFAIDQPSWGWALLALSVVYHGAVYAVGQRLLRPEPTQPAAATDASAAQQRPETSITTPVADQLTYPPHEKGQHHGPRTIEPRG